MGSSITVPSIPIITVFVRHAAECPRRADSFAKTCKCRKHLRWSYAGRQETQSAKTRSWALAEEAKRKVEEQFRNSIMAAGAPPSVSIASDSKLTTERALDLFLSDKKSQGIASDVLKKYERELKRFEAFLSKRSRFFPHEIRREDLTEFRAGWEDQYPSSTTRAKVQERLKSFLRYCHESSLIDKVPKLSAIRVDAPPTLPLSPEQYGRLLEVIPERFPETKAIRTAALVQMMRYSGLAIRDAVTLERSELQERDGVTRITTSRQKTGTHVSVPIPPDVARQVTEAMLLNENPSYLFWNSGTGKPQSAVTNWQHDLRQAFRAAGMPEGHPHQLRDTFAVSLLEKGVPLEEVSKLLGHESIKTTEKYYAKWVKARQDRLDLLVVGTW